MDYEAFLKEEQEKQKPIQDRVLERIKLMELCSESESVKADIYRLCKEDIFFFIENFCYVYEPRDQMDIPIILFDFQKFLIKELVKSIDNGETLVVEKSRDMGLTWSVCLVFLWKWLFHGNCAFLLGSHREADVDGTIKENPAHIMGKIRYNLYRLPRWMRPTAHLDVSLGLFNKDKNATIDGSSSTADFGRSRRYTAIFFDELAFWDTGEAAWNQTSQTTNCRIGGTTPNPKATWHCKMMLGETFTLEELPYEHSKGLANLRGVEG
jgi:hypothetical protein